ncbi:unnamed protein product [Closterium sp. NIES-64]|nr:unnamed protein product [Closterium sp. NIES-64]
MVFDQDLGSRNPRDSAAGVQRRVENAASNGGNVASGEDARQGLSDFEQEKLERAALAARDWEKFLLSSPRRRRHIPGVNDSSPTATSSGAHQASGIAGSAGAGAGRSAAAGMPSSSAVTQGISLEEMAESMGLPTSARTSLKHSTSDSSSSSNGTRDSISSISASISNSSSSSSSPRNPQPATPAPLGGAPLQFRGGASPRTGGKGGSSGDQRLEELLAGGTGGGVRAKYAARLQEKKMLAEARREQQGGGFGRAAAAVASAAAAASTAAAAARVARLRAEKGGGDGGLLGGTGEGALPGIGGVERGRGWVVAPGSARLLRHFQSRTLKQALVTTHPRLDVLLLNDQLGNFSFDSHINVTAGAAPAAPSASAASSYTPTSSTPPSESCSPSDASQTASATSAPGPSLTAASSYGVSAEPGGTLPNEALRSPPAAVPGIDSLEAARKRVDDFVETCKKWNLKPSQVLVGTAGWSAWWKQLSEGTLHKNGMRDGDVQMVGERKQVADWLQASARFKAADMVELKGVVEELNGVSFRSSTISRVPSARILSATWKSQMVDSIATWQSWELPVPFDHSFWSHGAVAAADSSDVAKLQTLRCADAGWAPSLLAMLAVQPPSGAACNLISRQLHSLLLWDDWMKRHGSPDEFSALASVFGAQERLVGDEQQAAVGGDLLAFPRRLDAKFPLKKKAFCDSLSALRKEGAGSSKFWLERYLRSLQQYALVGLPLHQTVERQAAAGDSPSLDDYLMYRAATSPATPAAFLAAASRNLPFVSDSTLESLVLPLLFVGSAFSALKGDSLLERRRRLQESASLPASLLFDAETGSLLLDTLEAAFVQMAAKVEKEAKRLQLASERVAVSSFVRLIRSVVHGVSLWQGAAWRFRDLTAAPAGGSVESFSESASYASESDSDSEDEWGTNGSRHSSLSSMSSSGSLSDAEVPQWILEQIEAACARFVAQ